MPTVLGHRVNMREHNLSDTERDPSALKPGGGDSPRDERSADGSYNDLGCPWMGMASARFGRNVPIGDTYGEKPRSLRAQSTPGEAAISWRAAASCRCRTSMCWFPPGCGSWCTTG